MVGLLCVARQRQPHGMCHTTLVSAMVFLVRRLSLDSDDLGFPDRDVVSFLSWRILGEGTRCRWRVYKKSGRGALESHNRRSQGARSRGNSRRGGQAEEERVWVPPRLL